MKVQYIFIIIAINVILFSCRSDEYPKADQVVYTKFEPTIKLFSVDSFVDNPVTVLGCEDVPVPASNYISYYIDIDGDSVKDYIIGIGHNENSNYCGHCKTFIYSISITPLCDECSVGMEIDFLAKIFGINEKISSENMWSGSRLNIVLKGCMLPFYKDFTSGYLALKKNNMYGYICINKISNNGIEILETGINKTLGNSIICRQSN